MNERDKTTAQADSQKTESLTELKVVCEVIAGSRQGARFEFSNHDTLLVGRSRSAQLALTDDPHFSRHHFLLELNPPRGYVRDLGSRNGTLLNGQSIKEAPLRDGDIISAGKTQIRFKVIGRPEPLTVAWPAAKALASAPPRAPTTAIPGYEIVQKLGQGGMGIVYLARQLSNGQTVALKVIVPESAADEASMRRFLREATVLSQLKHPRIVQFLELGMAAGQFFFAMEYVEPADLQQHLAGRSPASRVKTVCGIVCQVLEALRFAHGEGFIHRDIKPANILLTRVGRRLRTKLADFGLAKQMENAGFSGLTRAGEAIGTLAFMAPEQVTHSRDVRATMDLYSAGATLYQLLSGELPFDFPAGRDPFVVILEDEPVSLQVRSPDVPAELAAIVHRALAKDPSQRFATADAMWQSLARFAAGQSK